MQAHWITPFNNYNLDWFLWLNIELLHFRIISSPQRQTFVRTHNSEKQFMATISIWWVACERILIWAWEYKITVTINKYIYICIWNTRSIDWFNFFGQIALNARTFYCTLYKHFVYNFLRLKNFYELHIVIWNYWYIF